MTDTTALNTKIELASPHTFWALAIVYGLLGPIAAFAMMGTVPLVLLSLLGHTSIKSLIEAIRKFLVTPIGLTLLALTAWGATTFFWSESLNFIALFRLFWIAVAAGLLKNIVNVLDYREKGRLSIIVVAAFSFLLVILLFEGATEALLHRLIRPMDVAPRDGEWVPYLQMVAARGTAILAPFCFITAALIVQISERLLAGIVFIALSFVATLQLPMDASTLAIACGAAAFLFVRWRPRLMTRFLFTGILALAFALPLLMSSVITHDNILSVGIEPTRGQAQRLAVWEYSAHLILERPVVGFGFDASRDIGSRGEIIPETNWPALPLHPHNAFLQVWLELGLIGICLLCVFLWQIWRYFEARIVENHDIAILVAAFVATLVISLISFGIWQYWWIATWGLLIGACKLLESVRGNRLSYSAIHQP